jgi:hypothetical protein
MTKRGDDKTRRQESGPRLRGDDEKRESQKLGKKKAHAIGGPKQQVKRKEYRYQGT